MVSLFTEVDTFGIQYLFIDRSLTEFFLLSFSFPRGFGGCIRRTCFFLLLEDFEARVVVLYFRKWLQYLVSIMFVFKGTLESGKVFHNVLDVVYVHNTLP